MNRCSPLHLANSMSYDTNTPLKRRSREIVRTRRILKDRTRKVTSRARRGRRDEMIRGGGPEGGRRASRDSRAALTGDGHRAAALELQGLEKFRGRRRGRLVRRHRENTLAGHAAMVATPLSGSGGRARAVPHEREAGGRREGRSARGIVDDVIPLLPRSVSLRGSRRGLPDGSGGGSNVTLVPKLG